MFWSDTFEDTIYQANLNGTDMRVLLNESLEVVGECFAQNYDSVLRPLALSDLVTFTQSLAIIEY